MTFIEKVVSVQRDLKGLNPYSIGIWSATPSQHTKDMKETLS